MKSDNPSTGNSPSTTEILESLRAILADADQQRSAANDAFGKTCAAHKARNMPIEGPRADLFERTREIDSKALQAATEVLSQLPANYLARMAAFFYFQLEREQITGNLTRQQLQKSNDERWHQFTALDSATKKSKQAATNRAIAAANTRHINSHITAGKTKLIEIWESGKYKTKNACAEKECSGLNISRETARRALINIPKPS